MTEKKFYKISCLAFKKLSQTHHIIQEMKLNEDNKRLQLTLISK
jgi:hypothetical protein